MTETRTNRTTMTIADTSTRSSTTRTREDMLELIAEMYADVLERQMPNFIRREIETNLASGYDPEWYLFALKETAGAPRPSWRYTEAIVNRLRNKAWKWELPY